MLEERRIYLGKQEDYAKGFYTRNLFTKYGKVQDLKVSAKLFVFLPFMQWGGKHKKNFSVFGKYLWCILFTLTSFKPLIGDTEGLGD